MTDSRILRSAGLFAVVALLAGCYQLVYRGQDEKNLRRQLHVPSDVRTVSLDGDPKSAGFIGREGLQIHAVFEFDADQLERYVAAMHDPAAWKPQPLVAYSPDRADEYSADSMRWREGPAPPWTETRLRDWPSLPEVRAMERARIYCSVIAIVRGDRIERADGSSYDSWRYVGCSCAEAESLEQSNVVTILGALDLDTRRLHAHIAFSG